MKKLIALILAVVIALSLAACGAKEQTTPNTPNATFPSVMYEGKLYKTTGKQIPAEVDETAIVGHITSVIPLSQLPSNEGEANFGQVGDPYALTSDGLLVLVDHEWTIFELVTGTEAQDEMITVPAEVLCYRNGDGTWSLDGITYKYMLEISGRMPNSSDDITFVYLSNLETITFEQAWKAAGYSSNTADYFDVKDAVLIETKNGIYIN